MTARRPTSTLRTALVAASLLLVHSASAQTHLLKHIDVGRDERAHAFEPAPNGDLLLGGESEPFRPFLIRLTDMGDVRWSHSFAEGRRVDALLALEGGDVVAGGSERAHLWCLDASGNPKWHIALGEEGLVSSVSTITERDGRLIAVVIDREDRNPGGKARLLMLGLDGVVLDQVPLPGDDIEILDIESIDDGFVVAGRQYAPLGQNNYRSFVSRIAEDGTEVWTESLPNEPSNVALLYDSSVAVVGPDTCRPNEERTLCLVRLDLNGSVLDLVDLTPEMQFLGMHDAYVEQGKSGDLVIAAGVFREGSAETLLLRVTTAGKRISQTSISATASYTPAGVSDASGGGILTAGRYALGSGDDAFFIARTDAQDEFPILPRCFTGHAEATLDIGNARVAALNRGPLVYFTRGGFEIPKGSGISAIDDVSLWIGGTVDGDIRMAKSYWDSGDFWPGPLDVAGSHALDCSVHDRIYGVTTDDVLQFETTGIVPPNLEAWPWQYGAPVVDGDGDPDNYDLDAGDRPWVHGDQTLWWTMNDAGGHHDFSRTKPIHMEVQTTAFAGSQLCGLTRSLGGVYPALRNAIYYKVKLIYRGSAPLENAWFGTWMHNSLGEWQDDFVGSDSVLSLAFTYNADDYDDQYGQGPPAFGVTIVRGPTVAGDDGSARTLPATRYFVDTQWAFRYDSAIEDYRAMQGIWRDGTPVTFGGTGYNYGLERSTHFMFPSMPPDYWSEEKYLPSWDGGNTPGGRRSILSTGPFRMEPGDVQEIALALVWSDGGERLASVRKLKGEVAGVRSAFDQIAAYGVDACLADEQLPDSPATYRLAHHPNPTSGSALIQFELPRDEDINLAVYDILGRKVAELASGLHMAGSYEVQLKTDPLAAGVYVYRLETATILAARKLTVVK